MRIVLSRLHAWRDRPGIVLLVLLDQASKLFFPYQINPGVAFSLGSGLPPVLVTSILIVLVGVIFWLTRSWLNDGLSRLARSFLLAGALSNLIDRLFLGGVRDVWKLPFLGVQNNLADWLIVIGAAIFGWQQYRTWREVESEDKIPA